jgi:hypothetical protein
LASEKIKRKHTFDKIGRVELRRYERKLVVSVAISRSSVLVRPNECDCESSRNTKNSYQPAAFRASEIHSCDLCQLAVVIQMSFTHSLSDKLRPNQTTLNLIS